MSPFKDKGWTCVDQQSTHLFWWDIEAAETSLGDGRPEVRGCSTPSSYSGGSSLCKAVFELPQEVRSKLLHVPSSVRYFRNSSLQNDVFITEMVLSWCIVPFTWAWWRWTSLLDWWPFEWECGEGKPALVFVKLETCHQLVWGLNSQLCTLGQVRKDKHHCCTSASFPLEVENLFVCLNLENPKADVPRLVKNPFLKSEAWGIKTTLNGILLLRRLLKWEDYL